MKVKTVDSYVARSDFSLFLEFRDLSKSRKEANCWKLLKSPSVVEDRVRVRTLLWVDTERVVRGRPSFYNNDAVERFWFFKIEKDSQ